jgi:AcrR family transcriptional regulator
MTAVSEPVRGRPRSAAVDDAIVSAALELVAEEGIGGLSVEAVAVRAGVGKATIYRRWSCKAELLDAAFTHLSEQFPEAQGETTRDRLVSLFTTAGSEGSPTLRLLPRILSHKMRQPQLYRDFFDRVIEPRREQFRVELRRGIERGDIRPDLELDTMVNALVAPYLYRVMVLPVAGPPPMDLAASVVDVALRGLAPR